MSPYENPDAIAMHLQAADVDCTVTDDGFVRVPIDGLDYDATVTVEGAWVVFRMFVGDFGKELTESTSRGLLLLNQRLLGFRFAAEGGEVWVQEEFPVGILNDQLHVYLLHAMDVLPTVVPSLLPFFDNNTQMSDADIDAVFGQMGSNRPH